MLLFDQACHASRFWQATLFFPAPNQRKPTPMIPESKHQKPSSKHQRNPKFQAPNRGPRFELGTWSLELLWSLVFGVWSFDWPPGPPLSLSLSPLLRRWEREKTLLASRSSCCRFSRGLLSIRSLAGIMAILSDQPPPAGLLTQTQAATWAEPAWGRIIPATNSTGTI